jgi:hypothetical protein
VVFLGFEQRGSKTLEIQKKKAVRATMLLELSLMDGIPTRCTQVKIKKEWIICV